MSASPVNAIWRGTADEARELNEAIGRNCDCAFGMMGMRVSTCAPHAALLNDQRWLDHLVFLRRMRDCLLRQDGVTEEQ